MYRQSKFNNVCHIHNKAKKITENLPVADRTDKLKEKEDDKKDEFPNKISCWLINPCKLTFCKIGKMILDKINISVLSHTKVNQCKVASAVVYWFKNIPDNLILWYSTSKAFTHQLVKSYLTKEHRRNTKPQYEYNKPFYKIFTTL